jgi:hypothetical protein
MAPNTTAAPRPGSHGHPQSGEDDAKRTNDASDENNDEFSSASSLALDEIRVEGRTYSALDLAKLHPGGQLFVRAFGGTKKYHFLRWLLFSLDRFRNLQ